MFSPHTLGEFEDASASIVLRQLDRAFEGAGIRAGEDPGGPDGSRRTRFRRYVASINQADPEQLNRLGAALGALIDAVATSKEEYLVKAAERDGFFFSDGVFRPADGAAHSFTIACVEDLASLDERARRLYLLANDSPSSALGGAKELVESVCRTVLHLVNEPAPGESAGLAEMAVSTLSALELVAEGVDASRKRDAVIATLLPQLGAIVATLGEFELSEGSDHRRAGVTQLSSRHARLAVGAATTFASFVAETYAELRSRRVQ